eukprot:symbB.v1.2.001210.t1/scaffold66.1/size357995/13
MDSCPVISSDYTDEVFQVIDHQRLPFQRHTCGMCKTHSFLQDRAFLLFHFASVAMDELDLDLYGDLNCVEEDRVPQLLVSPPIPPWRSKPVNSGPAASVERSTETRGLKKE